MLKYHAASGEVRLTADRDYKSGQSCLLPPRPLLTLVFLNTIVCDLGLRQPMALLLLWNRHASSIQGCWHALCTRLHNSAPCVPRQHDVMHEPCCKHAKFVLLSR